MKIDLKNLNLAELESWAISIGEKPFRGRQLHQWIFQKGVKDFQSMHNISAKCKEKLERQAELSNIKLIDTEKSEDSGTIKFLFELNDGKRIESVYLPEKSRTTVCVSSQVGCNLDCGFCATALMGFTRNLNHAEIVDQVMKIEEFTESKVSNVVFMGMGEPFFNYRHVIRAAYTLASEIGLAIAQRRITISTSGIVPVIRRYIIDGHKFGLAISLTAVTDELRNRIMPVNKKYPIAEILECAKAYSASSQDRITFAYVLLKGINDSLEDAEALLNLTKDIPCKINLIPNNPSAILEKQFGRPGVETIEQFREKLHEGHQLNMLRNTQGKDIGAACGQLYIKTYQKEMNTV